MNQPDFTNRQQEVIARLLEGKSNKQIALALRIKPGTVEYHLKKIYGALNVGSRAEAILTLGKSVVGEKNKKGYLHKKRAWKYEKPARFPDDHTVGLTIARSNAFKQEVHGLFGARQAWPPQAGYVRYKNIHIPKTKRLYLQLRYSKHSPAIVPILVFMDDETTPRANLILEDQGSWNRFTWTESILLGAVQGGRHTITFYTDGQEYGVADLDTFILTTEPP